MAPTCFGLRPTSGSLQLSLAAVTLIFLLYNCYQFLTYYCKRYGIPKSAHFFCTLCMFCFGLMMAEINRLIFSKTFCEGSKIRKRKWSLVIGWFSKCGHETKPKSVVCPENKWRLSRLHIDSLTISTCKCVCCWSSMWFLSALYLEILQNQVTHASTLRIRHQTLQHNEMIWWQLFA